MGRAVLASYGSISPYDASTGYGTFNNSSYGYHFKTAGSHKLTILNNGNVGIGTTDPNTKLDVRGHLILEPGTNPVIFTGTGNTELNRYLVLLNSQGYASASGLKAGGVLIADANDYGAPSKNDLIVKGNVMIGKATQINTSHKLDVNGNIRANKIVVNATGADFVFDTAYRLRPLHEVEKYIEAHRHLPDIAPAIEMQKEGLDVGENQTKLLQKIEELTLYIINLNKKVEQQDLEINKQKDEIKKLIENNSAKETVLKRGINND